MTQSCNVVGYICQNFSHTEQTFIISNSLSVSAIFHLYFQFQRTTKLGYYYQKATSQEPKNLTERGWTYALHTRRNLAKGGCWKFMKIYDGGVGGCWKLYAFLQEKYCITHQGIHLLLIIVTPQRTFMQLHGFTVFAREIDKYWFISHFNTLVSL